MAFFSPRKFSRFILTSLITIAIIFGTGISYANLPALGDPSFASYSSQQEKQLGLTFYRSLRANLKFVNDLQINAYLNALGNRLASHSDAAGNQFHFFMINSPTINAFAGPDAYIGVHSRLFIDADNESQLAGVLAHEIAHVAQHHLARQFARSGKSTAITLATMLAAILVGAQDPQAGQAILLTGLAGQQQSSLNFTRENEYEADRIGIGILTRSGINPRGMVQFFEKLLATSPANGMEYLRTHPLSANRVSEAKNRISKKTINYPRDSLDFEFAKARLIVLVSKQPKYYTHDINVEKGFLGQYQKALAFIRTNQANKAIPVLLLLQKNHKYLWIKLALAEAYTANQQDGKALALLRKLADLYPGYLPVTIAYTKSLLNNKKPERAVLLLKQQLQQNAHLLGQDYAIVYHALAQAYFANGQTSAALEATGNQYAREGYLELAIQQYNNALLQKNNSPSTIKRLQTIKNEIKQRVTRLKESM